MTTPRVSVPVLIVGGGPAGMTFAALLGRLGVACLVIEADATYCVGSRAICVSPRSQEIMGYLSGDGKLTDKSLPWTVGRSYWQGTEVLHFQMPTEPAQRFAPMLNIQQYYIEEYAHQAAIGQFLQRFPDFQLTELPTRGGRARFRGFLHAPFSVA